MRFAFLVFVAMAAVLFGSDTVLQERLRKAKSGDYIVTEANKMISILAIRSVTPQSLVLEEISIPSAALAPRPASWSEWVRKRAPGHTSWSMTEIDLQNRQLLECYSFSRSAWLQPSSQECVLSTLLGLALQETSSADRRRIGPPPPSGEADQRMVWSPPLVIEGRQVTAKFSVFHADWPEDGSEMSGNRVTLYFDAEGKLPFPAWIQVNTSHAAASLRVIDSGHGLPSLHRALPRRVPEFIGIPQKTASGLRLSLKSPKYYRHFELFAVDITSKEKQICPVTYSLVLGEGEMLQIEIDHSELNNILQPDHRYTWLIVPIGHSEFYTESLKPFVWKIEN